MGTILTLAALEYLAAGLTVMPLTGKAPAAIPGVTGWPQMSGKAETPEDVDMVDAAFMRPDVTGVAIIIPPGMAVVDIDGEEGARVLAEMCGEVPRPHTGVASTGRGLHLYYATVGEVRTTKLGEKLDLKGVGGYVAAPPSVHPSGATYEWLDPLVVSGRVVMDWLLPPVEEFLKSRAIMAGATVRREPQSMFALDPTTQPWTWTRVTVEVNLAGLIDRVARAKEGERNNVLNWAAFSARQDGVPYEDALRELGTAASEAGLDEHEVRQTIRSAYR